MKHGDIIEKLDPLRKVALVASGLERTPFEQAGVPPIGRADLAELGDGKGTSYASAARSWDVALLEKATHELAAEAGTEGNRLVITPDLKTAVNPYKRGLSEDPCLNGALGAAMARGAHEAGAAVGLSRLSLSPDDVAWLDRRENAGAVHDLMVKPFLACVKKEKCDAVFLTPNRAGGGYPNTNRSLFTDVTNGYFGEDVFAVGDGNITSSDALSLLHGKVCLGGAALPLERAARRYAQLSAYKDEGSVSERDLEDSVREGSALDEARLNEAADEIIDFALRIVEYPAAEPTGDEARKKLAADSIVLLRNEKLLPLAEGTRVAVIGEISDASALEKKFRVVGRARGYDSAAERSDALIPEAVRSTNEADVVLVFLRPDPSGRSLSLPANRLALLDALKRTRKKIVSLMCTDLPVDMSFDSALPASLLLPPDGPYAGEAIAAVLSGAVTPSGKLTRTLYDGAEENYREWKENRDEGRIRVGTFTGYRRYDTAEESVRYPFGFGLSYTAFSYSRLTAEGDTVSFTVENSGSREGAEVAQIYVGAPDGTHVVPKKVLKAFVKIPLKAGESRRVSVKLPASEYATFDDRTLADNVESGTYRVYVCSSSLDVRLQGKRVLEGTVRERTEENLADYLPNGDYAEVENVSRENRIAKADGGKIPKGLRIAKKTALYCLPVLAVIFFLLMTMVVFATALDYSLIASFRPDIALWVMYAIAVAVFSVLPLIGSLNRKRLKKFFSASVVLCPILLFACFVLGFVVFREQNELVEDIVMRVLTCVTVSCFLAAVVAIVVERELARSKSGVNRWEKFYFEEEKEETTTSESEFEEAFRAAETVQEKKAKPKAPAEEEPPQPVEMPLFYDKHLSYELLMRDCKQFASERGVLADDRTLRDIFAALSSTSLIIIPGGDGAKVCSAVAEYFGRRAYVDNAEGYSRCEDLFSQWKQGDRAYSSTQFTAALAAAKRESAYLHTVLIRHADPARLSAVFSPVADVIARRRATITLPDGTDVLLPPNLRIVVELDGENLAKIPEGIAEVAAVLLPKYKACAAAERKTIFQSIGYERFAALASNVRDEYPLGELSWKNVDRLDAMCRSRHIGNLLWVRMELHASVAAACGAEEAEALDGALASELYCWLCEVWQDDVCGGPLIGALTEVFGKNGVKQCKEMERAQSGKEAKQ